MKKTFSIVLFVLLGSSAVGQKSVDKLLRIHNSHSIPYISVEELRRLQMTDSIVILDAREPNEFQVSHILSSKNVGFNNFKSEQNYVQELNKTNLVVVYCSIGIRSEQIGEKLKKAGFFNVKNLYGGIFEWKNKNNPVIDSTGMETENVHTYSKKWSNYLHAGNPIY